MQQGYLTVQGRGRGYLMTQKENRSDCLHHHPRRLPLSASLAGQFLQVSSGVFHDPLSRYMHCFLNLLTFRSQICKSHCKVIFQRELVRLLCSELHSFEVA